MSPHEDCERRPSPGQAWRLAGLIFAQMLPATLIVPAIRPLFAAQHAGQEGAMHAFMALNMLGGLFAAPWIGTVADRLRVGPALLVVIVLLDALFLSALAGPVPTVAVLGMRLAEGALHVGAATILLSQAAGLGRSLGDGRVMGLAGSAIMLAIALGSALGGLVLKLDFRAPFWLSGLLLAGVAVLAATRALSDTLPASPAPRRSRTSASLLPALAVPIAASFVERFCVGCLVVTFALFAHRAHGLSDTTIGTLFTLMLLPFATLTYPMARLGDRVPRAALLSLGALIFGLSLAALGLVPPVLLPLVMIAAGIACAMMFAPTLCYAATLAGPDHRGRAMAFLNAAGCLGMLLGPAAAGITSTLFRSPEDPLPGYRAVFLLAALSVVVWLAACAPWLGRKLRLETSGNAAQPASSTS